MNTAVGEAVQAGVAFDSLAATYDATFTESLVGRAQRAVVWEAADRVFARAEKILELNCGTGEDALHLADKGLTVVACDASQQMIEVARRKLAERTPPGRVSLYCMPIERIAELSYRAPFNGVLSNFSGLNCVAELEDIADQLGTMLRPGAHMLLCVSTRFCLWEFAAYGLQGQWKKAVRRWSGGTSARVAGVEMTVAYRTIRTMRRVFAPCFRLRAVTAVGLAVPPSYMERWCTRHRSFFRMLVRMDRVLRHLPLLRGMGDHVLLEFERCEA